MSGVPDDVRARAEEIVVDAIRRMRAAHVPCADLQRKAEDFLRLAARPSVQPEPLTAREEAIAECLAHIDYVQKNIVIPAAKRKRFDLRDLNIAFRNALTLAKEQITGENADKWMTPEQAADRQRSRATPPEKVETE